jgi:hypothetical protein
MPRPLARAVPTLELVIAVALVSRPGVGGPLAVVLLVAFTAALRRAAARGVACACFGGPADRPASAIELVRNIGLLGAAGLASAAHPAVPALAAVIAVSTAGVIGVLGLALLDLKRTIGRVWGNSLAGEMTAEVAP